MVPRSVFAGTIAWAAFVVGLGGCSKEKLAELADKAKSSVSEGAQQVKQQVVETASQATTEVKETAGFAGEMELQLDAPVTAKACYASVLTFTSGRPGVLQLRSYAKPETESFPSFLIQANIGSTTAADLSGKTFPATVFVQSQAGGPIWYSDKAAPAQLKVVSTDDQRISGELVGGSLRSTDNATVPQLAGKFSGSMK